MTLDEFVSTLLETFFNVPLTTPLPSSGAQPSTEEFQQRTNAYKQQLAQNLSQLINNQIETIVSERIQELVNANTGLVMPSYPPITPVPTND